MFFPETAAQWHAALNDFPSLLFVLAFAFDIAAGITKRDALRVVAFWSMSVGAVGAIVALASGLWAEDTIEHGGMVHLVMERHQTLAIGVTGLFIGLATWRIWRRTSMRPREHQTLVTLSGLGVLGLLWTAHLGGTIVYGYGGGVPTEVLEGALQERQRGHSHDAGHEPGGTTNTEASDQGTTTEHEHD